MTSHSSGMATRRARTPPESETDLSVWNTDRAADRSTRGRILTAAERLFAEKGFAGVSMPAIAKASGITAGAIYRHFDSKDDLFFEIVKRAVQAARPDPPQAGFEAARDLPRMAGAWTGQPLKLLRELAVEIHSASAKHPRVRRLLRQSLDRQLSDLAGSIMDAQRAGTLASGNPPLTATAAFAFILGLMHMETLAPALVGDERWRAFVETRMAALLGVK
jgi:AcrR family transcriptional regulator